MPRAVVMAQKHFHARGRGFDKAGIQGFALVAALLLIVVVGIVTATVLQTASTEIKISGNQRQAVENFYAAEAGLAEGMARLRRRPGSERLFISDAGHKANSHWSAYILTSSDWSFQDDPDFSFRQTNLIPTQGNSMNTQVLPNSAQSRLSYWVKIRHKTEYDAEQAGHHVDSPHYLDQDGSTSRHRSNVGNIIYYGYPNADGKSPQALTTDGPTPWLPIEVITAHGGPAGSGVFLQAEVVHPPGPNHLGALYAVGDVTLAGQSGSLNGHDACGAAPSVSPVYSGGMITLGSSMLFEGVPATPTQKGVGLDLSHALDEVKKGATSVQSDLQNMQIGLSGVPEAYLAEVSGSTQPSRLLIRNTVGQGLLLVDGTAVLEEKVTWSGMVVVTGTLIIQGDGANLTVQGGIWAGSVQQSGGLLNVRYDSCQIESALLSQPLRVRTWKEVF